VAGLVDFFQGYEEGKMVDGCQTTYRCSCGDTPLDESARLASDMDMGLKLELGSRFVVERKPYMGSKPELELLGSGFVARRKLIDSSVSDPYPSSSVVCDIAAAPTSNRHRVPAPLRLLWCLLHSMLWLIS